MRLRCGLGRWIAVVLLSLSLAACAYGRHIDRGDAYYERGDYQAALAEYKAAQALDPDSAEAAERRRMVEARLAASYRDEMEAALAAGDYLAAIDAAQEAYDTLTESREVRRIVEEASNAASARAEELSRAGDYPGALVLYEEIATKLPPQRAVADRQAAQVRESWVDDLSERAQLAEEAGRRGAALLLWAKAAQLSGDPGLRTRRDALHSALRSEFSYTAVPVAGGRYRRSEQEVLSRLPRPSARTTLRVDEQVDPDEAEALVSVRVAKPVIEIVETPRTESGSYVSGTRLVENSRYHDAQHELSREERELMEDENEVTALQNELDQALDEVSREGPSPDRQTWAEGRVDRARRELEYARREVMDQRREVQHAREELAHTPQFLEEPVYSEHYYTVVTHEWQVRLQMTVRIDQRYGDAPPIDVDEVVSTSYADDTHEPQPLLGLSGDPLEPPAPGALTGELYDAASDVVAAAIVDAFEGWRGTLRGRARRASSDEEMLDLYGVYVVTNPGVIEPAVRRELSTRWRLPDPGATLMAE